MNSKTRNLWAPICGVFGCLCYGSGDWLMMYGDPSHMGKLLWLSVVLVIFAVLKIIASLMPVSAFRLGFTNGLMSESMIIWFALIFLGGGINK